ncbi:hypothetical protein Trydic_g13625 [Trypoxylus dichotomus]
MFYTGTIAEEPEAFYLINICHDRIGSKCLGAYIKERWVVVAWECAKEADADIAYLVGYSPNLNCTTGLEREINLLVFQSDHAANSDRELVLIRLFKDMEPLSGVKKIEIETGSLQLHEICHCFIYETRGLIELEVDIVNTEVCLGEYRDGRFETEIMICGYIDGTETILSGLTPLVCKEKLVGFVVGHSNSLLKILTVASQMDWIEMVTKFSARRSGSIKQWKLKFLSMVLVWICFRFKYIT